MSIAVIEGDLETGNDAERIRRRGVEAIQITTGTVCHLDAHMVHDVLHRLDLVQVDILFMENTGNLVCPAGFDPAIELSERCGSGMGAWIRWLQAQTVALEHRTGKPVSNAQPAHAPQTGGTPGTRPATDLPRPLPGGAETG